MSKGFFLVVGGIGGSGKTGLCKKIAGFFEEAGFSYIQTFEPGGTPAANYLRTLCRQGLPDCEPLTPMAEAMLFNAARAQHVETVIRPALAEGKVVICDRYAETTYAYQGAARGANIFNLQQVHHYGIGLDPDLTIILDGDAEVFMSRVSDQEKLTDKFDAMALATQERMQEYLAHLVERDNTGKFVDVEADGTREQLWEQVLPHLEKIKKHLFLNTIPNNKLEVGIKD
jgi:thymidylate kinase